VFSYPPPPKPLCPVILKLSASHPPIPPISLALFHCHSFKLARKPGSGSQFFPPSKLPKSLDLPLTPSQAFTVLSLGVHISFFSFLSLCPKLFGDVVPSLTCGPPPPLLPFPQKGPLVTRRKSSFPVPFLFGLFLVLPCQGPAASRYSSTASVVPMALFFK